MDRPSRYQALLDSLADLFAFVATVLLLLVIPRVLDWLDAVAEWWKREAIRA